MTAKQSDVEQAGQQEQKGQSQARQQEQEGQSQPSAQAGRQSEQGGTSQDTQLGRQARQQEQQTQSQASAQAGRQSEQGGTSQDTQLGRRGETREERGMAGRMPSPFTSPFSLLQRFFTSDISELFDDLAGSRGSRSQSTAAATDAGTGVAAWAPKVDVTQRGNELVVRADLPGVNADDVVVEISDDAITISGERQQEREEDRGSVYRYERTYGAFYRVIPLPEGAMADQATATFKNGVLEIVVPAPPEQVSRGRRLEVTQGDKATTGNTSNEQATRDQNRS
jgi:HSP20 family protein